MNLEWTKRQRLLQFGLAWSVALVTVAVCVAPTRVGADARAYWMAWRLGLYGTQTVFGGPAAFLYSPAFAAAVWPLTVLPWLVFQATWYCFSAAAWLWLLWPVRLPLRIPLLAAAAAVSLTGNIEWLCAVALVLAARHPSAWVVLILTKVSLGIGVAWYVFRGEWRQLAVVVGLTASIVLATWFLPWTAWFRFLLADPGGGYVLGMSIPIVLRGLVALPLVGWGARSGRPWVLPIAAVIVSPNVWLGTFALLAAGVRLAESRTALVAAQRGALTRSAADSR